MHDPADMLLMKEGKMGDLDYREIDDRYDRMSEIVARGNADRAQQENLARERIDDMTAAGMLRRSASGRPSPQVTGRGIIRGIGRLIIILLVIIVALYIFGWALATFVVK